MVSPDDAHERTFSLLGLMSQLNGGCDKWYKVLFWGRQPYHILCW